MKKWTFIAVLLIFAGCSKKEPDIYFNSDKALKYFRAVDSICNSDNGRLWGSNIIAPIMFVDRPTHRIFANKPDNQGLLKLRDGVYQGIFPKERIIENSAVEFGGVIYAMVPLPPIEDSYRIETAAINALYRCFQRNNGIPPGKFAIRYLDEKSARIWIKLELRALRKTISADSTQFRQYLRDAIIFRGARREQYKASIKDENHFEIYNGFSMLTSILLCNDSDDAVINRLLESINNSYKFPSFSRSYGSITGAIYSYLLYLKGFDLKTICIEDSDIGELVINFFGLEVPDIYRDVAGSLAVVYDVDSIYKEEEQRIAEIREMMQRQLSKFTVKPVLSLELESPNFDYEPEDIRSLDTLGIIYNAIRVSDNWGKLTVEKGGCLLTNNLKYIRLGAKNIKESKNHVYGDGWHLILNNNWKIIKVNDDYVLRRSLPQSLSRAGDCR